MPLDICEHGHLHRQCGICELQRERDDLRLENQRLRLAVCNQAGDNLCWLDDEQLGAIPPKAEFLKSCERYHAQIVGERGETGILAGCMTIAQLEAEIQLLSQCSKSRFSQRAERERDEARAQLAAMRRVLAELSDLRQGAAMAYQLAGACDANVKILDNLSALANQEKPPHSWETCYPAVPGVMAELEAARKDTERWDKLERLRGLINVIEGPGCFPNDEWVIWNDEASIGTGKTLRAAIDAMTEDEKCLSHIDTTNQDVTSHN